MSRGRHFTVDGIFALKMLLTVKFACLAGLAFGTTWDFALIGDTPYTAEERAKFPDMLTRIAAERPAFIAHIGDFKSGRSRCDDALYADRYQLFDASPVPFVYVPGDNEWSDCDRLTAGGYDPTERLGALRRVFWHSDASLGQQRLPLERQSAAFPEHSRFRLGPVLFVTLNLPGGNNNFGHSDTPTAEFAVREPAILAWLHDSFALARHEKMRGMVLLFQANPAFKHFAQGFGHRGYRAFLNALREETEGFAGEVVAVHGDTHRMHIDQPLLDRRGRTLYRFTRVETYGYPEMGWISGRIDSDGPQLLHFTPHPWSGHALP